MNATNRGGINTEITASATYINTVHTTNNNSGMIHASGGSNGTGQMNYENLAAGNSSLNNQNNVPSLFPTGTASG